MQISRGTFLGGAVITLVFLAGCASTTPSTQTSQRLDEILRAMADNSTEATSRRCLSTSVYNNVDVLDDRRLLFRGIGDRAWVNELRHRCPGLRLRDTLVFELHTNQACALDQVSAADRLFLSFKRTGPTCTLGEFQPVTPEQLTMIDDALRDN